MIRLAISLMVLWILISIPVALFVGRILAGQDDER